MGITEREKKLFKRWSKARVGFVPDGVVDEQSYLDSNPKLLFVMKEVNDPADPHFDLRKFIYQGSVPQTWDNVTRWVIGLRNLDKEIEWKKLRKITKAKRKKKLRSICVMNLKKTPGRYISDHKKLSSIASEDKKYLNEQFQLYDPDLVICCGSVITRLLRKLIGSHSEREPKMTSRGITYQRLDTAKYVISYLHPMARAQSCLLYYGLVDAVKEIVGNNN